MAETATKNLESAAGAEGTASRRLARVYAEALLNAAEKAGKAEAIEAEFEGVLEAVRRNPQASQLLSSKAVKKSARAPLVTKAFEGKVDPLVLDFIRLLDSKDRLNLLADTAVGYRELRDERAKRTRVIVRSAVPLSDEQKRNLIGTLEQTLHLSTILDARVEPDLLGGLVVQVGDEVYDNSVRTRIENLRNQLTARSSHEIQVGRDRFSSAS